MPGEKEGFYRIKVVPPIVLRKGQTTQIEMEIRNISKDTTLPPEKQWASSYMRSRSS